MAASYRFAVARFSPDDARGERLNIGLLVANGQQIDARLSKRLEKLRAISAAVDPDTIRQLLTNTALIAGQDGTDFEAALSGVEPGPLSFSQAGTFVAESPSAYEARIESIMRALVDPEPAPFKAREKRSRLLTSLKGVLRRERVLAQKGEGLSSHRVVPQYQLDEGLVADLVLKNGAMHIVETVDVTGREDQVRRAVSEIAVAALVLERARMKFGEEQTKTRLVFNASTSLEKAAMPSLDAAEHQGAELINWASANDRERFVHAMTTLAEPLPSKRRAKRIEYPALF